MEKKNMWIKVTKGLLDVMFIMGVPVILTLPWSFRFFTKYLPYLEENFEATVVVYFVMGIAGEAILWELKKIFKTVIGNHCFVKENVFSLQKMANVSFFIFIMAIVRMILHPSFAMIVVMLVFSIAGMFSRVLSYVFEQAVEYKEENDFTI